MVTPDWCGTFWGSTPKGVPGLNQYINGKDPHLHHKSTTMDFTLLRLEAGFAAAVRTMCLAHGHMDLASRWQHQLQDPDRAMPCAAGLRVRVDFALAAETYERITATEPPGSLATMMASMMDGQAEAALEAISPAVRAGIVSLFQHGTAEEIVVAAPWLPGELVMACDWLMSRDQLVWLPPHAIMLRHHAWGRWGTVVHKKKKKKKKSKNKKKISNRDR